MTYSGYSVKVSGTNSGIFFQDFEKDKNFHLKSLKNILEFVPETQRYVSIGSAIGPFFHCWLFALGFQHLVLDSGPNFYLNNYYQRAVFIATVLYFML